MQIADRLSQIRPSVTLAINARAQELRAQGVQVTSLGNDEPYKLERVGIYAVARDPGAPKPPAGPYPRGGQGRH